MLPPVVVADSNRTTQVRAKPNSVTIQDDHVDKAKSALAKKTADEEAEAYYWYRKDWENNCCKVGCEHFLHKTMLSSMQYTHRTPEDVLSNAAEALQIFSMKLKLTYDNVGGFEFPLSVYGFVAVRDTLDSRRNILFSRCATEAQQVTHGDPFLHLTGPSRAILSLENVCFEIYLRVKGAAGSRDKPLITWGRSYGGGPLCFDNIFCRLEVCLQTIEEAVQATIVAVQIVRKEGLWPYNFAYGGLVACTPRPRKAAADSDGASSSNQEIVLVKSIDREMLQGSDGYLHLSRQVVCVQGGGGLDVVIQAYEKSGSLRAEGCVHFKAQKCHMSQQQCIVGRARVNVTVAWSIVPTDMDAFGF